MSFSIKMDTTAAYAELDKLTVRAEQSARPAAQAAAQVLYDAVRANIRSSTKDHWFYGTQFRKTGKRYLIKAGTLKRSIYQVYSRDRSTPTHAVYHIAWNQLEAPYGFMVEFGTSSAPAHPFLRPAFLNNKDRALNAMEARFLAEVNKP